MRLNSIRILKKYYGIKIQTFLEPAWSRCSHSQIPCHVPRFSFPSVIGIVRADPRKQAFTCAGWNQEQIKFDIENISIRLCDISLHKLSTKY